MTRQPDEIKRWLDNPIHVHYHISDIEPRLTPLALHELEFLHADALDLIKQLEAELEDMTARYKIADDCAKKKGEMNEKLYAELAAVKAERDALKEALGLMVYQYCVRGDKLDHLYMCAGETAFRVLGLEQYGNTSSLESWLFPEFQDKEE